MSILFFVRLLYVILAIRGIIGRSIMSRELVICRTIPALFSQKVDKYVSRMSLAVDKGFDLL